MKKDNFDSEDFKKKIALGFDIAFQKLLKEKQAKDGTLVFSENGKIIKVKARDIK